MNVEELTNIIVPISQFSGIPGVLLYTIFLRSNKGNTRIVFYVLLASLLADMLMSYYIKYVYPSSYIVGTIWVIVDYLLLSWLFLKLIPGKGKIIFGLLGVFIIGSISTSIFFSDLNRFYTFLKSYPSVVFTFFSILVFLEILKEGPTNKLKNYPLFWIISAIFLFNSVTLLKNLFQQYLVFDLQIALDLYIYVYVFSVIFNIVKNIMFFYAFILVKRGNPDNILKTKPVTT